MLSSNSSDGVSNMWRCVKNIITSSLEINMICFRLTTILTPCHKFDDASKTSSHFISTPQVLFKLDGNFDSLSHVWRRFRIDVSYTSAYLYQILADLFFFPLVSSPITYVSINTLKLIKSNESYLRLCNYSELKASNVLASAHTSISKNWWWKSWVPDLKLNLLRFCSWAI